MNQDRFSWSQAGTAYFVVDLHTERIAALLYWTEGELGGERGSGGIFETYGPGWVWVPADDPVLYDLTAPALKANMTAEERHAAQAEAREGVERCLRRMSAGRVRG